MTKTQKKIRTKNILFKILRLKIFNDKKLKEIKNELIEIFNLILKSVNLVHKKVVNAY